eukprot:8761069-Pyramimonas_sp.AAC.1
MVFFLEAGDACYRVVPQFARQPPRAPGVLNDLLHDADMPEAFLHALRIAMEGAPMFNRRVEYEHLCALLQDAHTDVGNYERAHQHSTATQWTVSWSTSARPHPQLPLCQSHTTYRN